MLGALLTDRGKARQFFEENFAPFRILAEPGLLTSYFQPVLKGSRSPSPAFPIPVYRRPADLKPLPLGHALTADGLTAARDAQGRFEPYFTRAEIDEGALAGRGLEILYLADAIEAFIMHVQGSGLIELDDGTEARLTFDGKNGAPLHVCRQVSHRAGTSRSQGCPSRRDGFVAPRASQSGGSVA